MELLILLVEKDGAVVTREEIVDRLWGKDVFVDTEHGINTAIRKIRYALKENPEQPASSRP
jgi:DNA-binding winged helix-turn-helix (wHTH) protein